MPKYDSADLLARVKRYANRPSTDESMDDADWYAFLTEAQDHLYQVMAAHAPWVLVGAPEKLTTSDSGLTYDFASTPFGGRIEIRASRDGQLLRPGPDFDPGADFVWEGDAIRMPGGDTRTFSDGPYARYIAAPGEIDASTEPTLKPTDARLAIAAHAAALWAERSGEKDPAQFYGMEQRILWGDPRTPGDVGIVGRLKTQVHGQGTAASGHLGEAWYHGIDTGYSTL